MRDRNEHDAVLKAVGALMSPMSTTITKLKDVHARQTIHEKQEKWCLFDVFRRRIPDGVLCAAKLNEFGGMSCFSMSKYSYVGRKNSRQPALATAQ
ncbi:hypothetical protein MRB53_037372 [Persea americana]|nr:hypothetical protein MRB53_037372 [Persea americana]